MVRAKELFMWNPSFIYNKEKDYASEEESDFVPNNNDPNNHINEEVFGGVYGSDDDVGSKTVHNGGSMLGVMEDFIRICQAMGYAMDGSVNDLATIIGQQVDDNVIR
nr:RNA-directed DNA polymerase, eukaryota [Tanacetum cinerariifolium]